MRMLWQHEARIHATPLIYSYNSLAAFSPLPYKGMKMENLVRDAQRSAEQLREMNSFKSNIVKVIELLVKNFENHPNYSDIGFHHTRSTSDDGWQPGLSITILNQTYYLKLNLYFASTAGSSTSQLPFVKFSFLDRDNNLITYGKLIGKYYATGSSGEVEEFKAAGEAEKSLADYLAESILVEARNKIETIPIERA